MCKWHVYPEEVKCRSIECTLKKFLGPNVLVPKDHNTRKKPLLPKPAKPTPVHIFNVVV